MTIEVLPLGVSCNLACTYCYENPIRDAGNQPNGDYDMDAMKRTLAKENYHFTVFGGEPLLTPIDDLEELWRWGFERYRQNSIQTSATIVTERHFGLFRKYNVSVGISLDGPGELNEPRQVRASPKKTREATLSSEAVLHRLLEERHSVSLITTLHRGNASPDRLPRLLDWYRELDSRGLRHVNVHLMEIESEKIREEWALSEEENADALLACAELQAELAQLRFQPITDMVQLLLGDDRETSCIWNACDPMTTRAVRGVNGQGESINCSRTNKSGVDMQKADQELLVRPLALYHTPQEHGGCQGCRYWFACKGSCPGESIGGDPRRKTEHCGTLIRVFGALEKRLASLGFRPISLDENRRKAVEARLLESFAQGVPLRIHDALNGGPPAAAKHGDADHGDSDHGDHNDSEKPVLTHGDHTDQALVS